VVFLLPAESIQECRSPHGLRLFHLFTGLTNVTLETAPRVNAYMFSGSGLETPTGTVLPRLTPGVLPLQVLTGSGDGNQEETDNESIRVSAKGTGAGLSFTTLAASLTPSCRTTCRRFCVLCSC